MKNTPPASKAGLKFLLETGPVLAFFAGFLVLRGTEVMIFGTAYSGFVIVTAAFIPLVGVSTFLMWRLLGHVSKMQIVTLILLVIFGGMTVWFNDEKFLKIKPTILYLLFGGILGGGLLWRKNLLSSLMGDVLPLTKVGWSILTWRLVFLFFMLALFNEIVWRSFSTTTWVSVKTFGLPLILFIFFVAHAKFLETHQKRDDKEMR